MRNCIHWLIAGTLALTFAACNPPAPTAKEGETNSTPKVDKKFTIAMIPKGATHEFWKSVHAGAKKAAEEFGVELIWKGPLKEDDRESQITTVEDFIAQKVDGICLAPLDDTALRVPAQDAISKGIPIVIFDSGLKDIEVSSFVATDNFKAGKMGGKKLGALLNGKGNVILLRYQEGSASTNERESGFLEAMKEFPEIKIVSDNQYAGATVETAQSAAENFIARFGGKSRFNEEVQGVFTPNESSTFGTLRALQEAQLAGKVKLVGFDSSKFLIDGVKSGELNGFVVQNPRKMGYEAVKAMVAKLKGEAVEPRIDTGATVIEPDNIDKPEIQELIAPPAE